MRLECKNAEVMVVWDGQKDMQLTIKAQNGDLLFAQIQCPEATSTAIHKNASWDKVIGD